MQYPHSIVLTIQPEPEQNPVTGIFTASTGAVEAYTLDCRAEMNTAGKKLLGKDGASVEYKFDVYLPRTDIVIPIDADYVLTVSNRTFQGKVLGASNGQLNSRIWL